MIPSCIFEMRKNEDKDWKKAYTGFFPQAFQQPNDEIFDLGEYDD